MSRHRRPAAGWAVAGLIVGLALVIGGGQLLLSPPPAPDVGLVPGGATAVTADVPDPARTLLPVRVTRPGRVPVRAARPGIVPVRLRIPRLGVDASITPVGVSGGELDVPDDPGILGWWQGGARPDQGTGSVVINGHVDSYRRGPGAFFRLRTLHPGDAVEVAGDGGWVLHYVVTGRRQYAKSDLPAAEVFGQTPRPRLVLLTCGGRFDPHLRHYTDNVVVYAVPTAA